MVSILLAAAQAHFEDSSYAVANTFLGLLRQSVAHPAATWQQLGHLHFSLAEYEEAGQAYGYAAAYAPRDASLQVRLAHTCLCLEDFASFENYLRRALSLDSENTPALQLLADLNRDEGRYEEAIGFYERLLQSVPCHRANLVSLALCHSFLGAYGSALNCLQRADQAVSERILPTSPAPGADTSF